MRTLARTLLVGLLAAAPLAAHAGPLSLSERRAVAAVDRHAGESLALLQRLVEQNSGTQNFAGVRAVADLLRPEWEALGFTTRWVDGAAFGRAGHLLAERLGRKGAPRIVFVGHLDTVFEPASPFQHWEALTDSTARGPGIIDMKGGDVIQLLAVRALAETKQLDGLSITVVLSGDEENSGSPIELARADLRAAARGAAAVIGFEDGDGDVRRAVVARRGSSNWSLSVHGTPAHSSQIFRADIGPGAIFEAARILNEMRDSLAGEPNLTFNPGLVLGGTRVAFDSTTTSGTAFGKNNVIADSAYVTGDLRTLTRAQLEHTRAVMSAIAARHNTRTTATFRFVDGYPSLAPTEGNRRLLALASQASLDLGFGPLEAVDPMRAGAADVSFVGEIAPMVIDAMGLKGDSGHTAGEWANLSSLPVQAKRVAVLLARLAAH